MQASTSANTAASWTSMVTDAEPSGDCDLFESTPSSQNRILARLHEQLIDDLGVAPGYEARMLMVGGSNSGSASPRRASRVPTIAGTRSNTTRLPAAISPAMQANCSLADWRPTAHSYRHAVSKRTNLPSMSARRLGSEAGDRFEATNRVLHLDFRSIEQLAEPSARNLRWPR